ncbi:hypothetical protein BCR43DRAFT_489709 [Syncephalastrum racemosum]|uniref:RNase H type-1 domain-containing protein n=1 Tax=Syncephalastrum racemosum TaxID=13706 RepID=A0A1X2HER0_SYNRA|nr:hypothetical protein BCR43DRAFT_489709 [Syncephalastrum racemosum]
MAPLRTSKRKRLDESLSQPSFSSEDSSIIENNRENEDQDSLRAAKKPKDVKPKRNASRATKNVSQKVASAATTVLPTTAVEKPTEDIKTSKEEDVKTNTTATLSVYVQTVQVSEKSWAVGIVFGKDDKRNWDGLVDEESVLSDKDAAAWGAIRAIETCEDKTNTMTIYTNSDALCADSDAAEDSGSDYQKKLQLKVEERQGSIVFTQQEAEQHELMQHAYDLASANSQPSAHATNGTEAKDAPKDVAEEVEPMVEDTKESEVKDLEVGSSDATPAVPKDETQETAAPAADATTNTSWTRTVNLRNLLDILKAPFSRR